MRQEFTYYGGQTKEAGLFGDDFNAGIKGIQTATAGTSAFKNPFQYASKAYDGFTSGAMGSVAQRKLAPLQQNGVALKSDQYGIPQDVNVGQTVQNYGSKLLGGNNFDALKGMANNVMGGFKSLGEPGGMQNIGNTLSDWAGKAGNFINEYKMPLLGGLAAGGAMYGLKQLLSPARAPRSRYGVPRQYMASPYMAPQAFAKAASFQLPGPMAMPQRAAEVLMNGIDIPGLSGELEGQRLSQTPQEPMQQPGAYQPRFTTDNPELKKSLHDPRMRQYLTSLVQQVESNRTAAQ